MPTRGGPVLPYSIVAGVTPCAPGWLALSAWSGTRHAKYCVFGWNEAPLLLCMGLFSRILRSGPRSTADWRCG